MDIESLCRKLEDAIYEEQVEPKIKLIKDINSHKDKIHVYEKEKIMSAIVRTLNEDHRKSPDLTRALLIFLRGYVKQVGFRDSQEMMTVFSILGKIQAYENNRFDRMRSKHANLKKKSSQKASFHEQYLKENRFINTVIAKQNQIFYLSLIIALEVVFSLSEMEFEDPNQWQSVANQVHSYLKLIIPNLDRNDQALILKTLEAVSEIVQRFGVPQDIKTTYLSLRLQRFFESLVYLTPYLIFAQLFLRDAFSKAELKAVVPSLIAATNEKFFRENIINLVSLISSDSSVKETLVEKEFYLGLLMLHLKLVEAKVNKGVTKFEKFDLMRAMINSLINLANQPEQANLMIKNLHFKRLLHFAFETKDTGLLKLVNNVTYFCDPELTNVMSDKILLIRDYIEEIPALNKQTRPALYEMISILSNCCLGDKWEGFLSKNLLQLLHSLIQSDDGPLRLQAILLIAQLCRNEKTSNIMHKKGTYELILSNLTEIDDREEHFQRLYFTYQLVLSGFAIEPYLPRICMLIKSFLELEFAERNIRVVSFLNEYLFILQVKCKSSDIEALVLRR